MGDAGFQQGRLLSAIAAAGVGVLVQRFLMKTLDEVLTPMDGQSSELVKSLTTLRV